MQLRNRQTTLDVVSQSDSRKQRKRQDKVREKSSESAMTACTLAVSVPQRVSLDRPRSTTASIQRMQPETQDVRDVAHIFDQMVRAQIIYFHYN